MGVNTVVSRLRVEDRLSVGVGVAAAVMLLLPEFLVGNLLNSDGVGNCIRLNKDIPMWVSYM